MDGSDRHMIEADTAVAEARWGDARAAFTAALADGPAPDAMDGLGRCLWWLGETDEAVATRTRAYGAYRRAGRSDEATRVAVWLALEHAAAPGREALARGWMMRAERLVEETGSVGAGWLALARSVRETDPLRIVDFADEALASARANGDPALEIRALARSGLGLTLAGRTADGIARLDEAMAAASAGEADQPEVFAEACCDMVAACEATLDGRRLEQWGRAAEQFMDLRPHPSLLGFCGSCCAGILAARGDLAAAERWLTWTIDRLARGGHASRCVDPKARLAELRVSQGRIEEAERLLTGIEARPESLRAVVAVHVVRGELGAASSALHRRLAKVGADSTAAIPILTMLVPIQVDRGDLDGAATSVERIGTLAAEVGGELQSAYAEIAAGRLALALREADRAADTLRRATERFDRVDAPIEAARARVLLAEALAASDIGVGRSGGARRVGRTRRRRPGRRGGSGRCARTIARRAGTGGTEAGGRAHEAGDGGARPHRRGAEQRPDRRPAVHQRRDCRAPREQRARQARAAEPDPGGRLRTPPGIGLIRTTGPAHAALGSPSAPICISTAKMSGDAHASAMSPFSIRKTSISPAVTARPVGGVPRNSP